MRIQGGRNVGAVAAVILVVGASLFAQAARPEPDGQAALLVEVRALRQALEQLAAAGPRVQLAFGRLQLQEQRINSMLRRLETLRDSIAQTERELTSNQAQLSGMEKMFKTDAVPPEQVEAMVETLKRGVTLQTAELSRLQAEEATLQGQVATEQSRWSDINRALDELERTLGRP